jgi:hypothetical protein
MTRFDVPEFGDIAELSAEAYAARVRVAYDQIVQDCEDPQALEAARHVLLQFVGVQLHAGLISVRHQALAKKMLPKPKHPRGRPKDAQGDDASGRNWQLLYDWVYDKTLDPALTEEQFAKRKLGISDADYDREDELQNVRKNGKVGPLHYKVDALLKNLQPSRLKERLGEGVIRAIYVQATLTSRNAAGHFGSRARQDGK